MFITTKTSPSLKIKPAIYDLDDDCNDDAVTIQNLLKTRISKNKSFHCAFLFWDKIESHFMESQFHCNSLLAMSPSLSFWGQDWKNIKFSQKFTFILPSPSSTSINTLHPTPEILKSDLNGFIDTNRDIGNCELFLCSHTFHHGIFLLEHDDYTDLFIVDYFYKKRSIESPMQWIRLYNNAKSATSTYLGELIQVYKNEHKEVLNECLIPIRSCFKDRYGTFDRLKSINMSDEDKKQLQLSDSLTQSFLKSDIMQSINSQCHINYVLPIVYNNSPVICVGVENVLTLNVLYRIRVCMIEDTVLKTKTTKQVPGCCKRLNEAHAKLQPGCRFGIKYDSYQNEASIGCFVSMNNVNYILTAGHAFTNKMETKSNVEFEFLHGPPLDNQVSIANNKYYPGAINAYHKESYGVSATYYNSIENEKWKDVALIKMNNNMQFSNVAYENMAITDIDYSFNPKIGDIFNIVASRGLVELEFHSPVYLCNWDTGIIIKEMAFAYIKSSEKCCHGDSGNVILRDNVDVFQLSAVFVGVVDGYAIGISMSDLIPGLTIAN